VTISGGEPLLQEAFLLELLKECRRCGIHTTLDTSGYATREIMEHVASYVDLFLYDLKLIDEGMHRKYTGVSNKSILENLIWLYSSGKKVILRFPVIPGITDTIENIRDMKSFITRSLPHISTSPHQHISTSAHQLSLLPYHSIARDKYRRFCKSNRLEGLPDLNPDVLVALKTEFESLGLEVTIGS
jgi:pyruvate formate lyase activating enzyme